jgi:hypothetical protein
MKFSTAAATALTLLSVSSVQGAAGSDYLFSGPLSKCNLGIKVEVDGSDTVRLQSLTPTCYTNDLTVAYTVTESNKDNMFILQYILEDGTRGNWVVSVHA